jgi:hypothetical protein
MLTNFYACIRALAAAPEHYLDIRIVQHYDPIFRTHRATIGYADGANTIPARLNGWYLTSAAVASWEEAAAELDVICSKALGSAR